MTTEVEGELEKDENGKWLWKTAEGRLIPVELLPDSHLRNIALFLMGMGFRRCIAANEVRVVWLRILRVEWEHRLMARGQEKKWKLALKEYEDQKELGE